MCSDFNWQRDNAIVQKSIPRDKCEAMRRITMWFVLLNAMAQKTSALGVSMAEDRSRRRRIKTWVMWYETISTSNVVRQLFRNRYRERTVKLWEWWMETQSDTFCLMRWFQKTPVLSVSMAEERSRRRKIETWVMWCETISTSNVIRQSSKMDRETTVKLLEWWMETQSDTFGLMLWFQKTSASVCRWPKREEEGESEKCRRFDVGGAAR